MFDITHIIFGFVAFVICVSSVLVILSKNPVRSALFLVLSFIGSAVLWLMSGSEFLALILIVVYVGAVMTLFLFVIMMLDIDRIFFKPKLFKYFGVGIILGTLVLGTLFFLVTVLPSSLYDSMTQTNNIEAIGQLLYTDYAYPFVIAGVLLLIAIIASVALVHRAPRNVKTQHPPSQMQVRKDERVRLVDVNPTDTISISSNDHEAKET